MSDLLGSTVKDLAGRPLGDVHDVRLVQNGPILGSWGAAFTADALLVGPHAVGVRLGYGRSEVRGPWVVRATFEAIHGVLDVISWHSIVAIQPGTILVRKRRTRRTTVHATVGCSTRAWSSSIGRSWIRTDAWPATSTT